MSNIMCLTDSDRLQSTPTPHLLAAPRLHLSPLEQGMPRQELELDQVSIDRYDSLGLAE
jgi:hypothetical protein